MCDLWLQEEEQLAVRDHLDTTVANTNIYGQASAKKPVPVPEVTFSELWRATQGFDQKYAPCLAHGCKLPDSSTCLSAWSGLDAA